MRIGVVLMLLAATAACRSEGPSLFRQYEYEEEMYLSLDGSATIYVNGSVQAFNALRGTSFDSNQRSRFDDAAVRAYFSSPATRVTRVSRPSRRNNRRYIHVRIDVDDVRRLGEAPPFAWSKYRFERDGNLMVYQQTVGAPAAPTVEEHSGPNEGEGLSAGRHGTAAASPISGDEIVAFRIHVPSVIVYHNTGEAPRRGNILVWEQTFAERLQGKPLLIDARMETESILLRTLLLFLGTILAVAATFALVIWWVARRPRRPHAA
jgi:hypothetical protein